MAIGTCTTNLVKIEQTDRQTRSSQYSTLPIGGGVITNHVLPLPDMTSASIRQRKAI